jgi:hypothetical protein
LAVRLAVKLSVNDARVAAHAKSLANARMSQYRLQRDREAEIAVLKSVLDEKERKAELVTRNLAEIAPVAPLASGKNIF